MYFISFNEFLCGFVLFTCSCEFFRTLSPTPVLLPRSSSEELCGSEIRHIIRQQRKAGRASPPGGRTSPSPTNGSMSPPNGHASPPMSPDLTSISDHASLAKSPDLPPLPDHCRGAFTDLPAPVFSHA
uniref:Uncharacterized protein n=1 Tax=Physcomitrium patens TaxID=3218 RepID=A0A2K1KUZ5_PHYPA|nr:hypothetical protein PHYPA_004606 [Physcomitrium patens]